MVDVEARNSAKTRYQPSVAVKRSVLDMKRSLNKGQLRLRRATTMSAAQMSAEYGNSRLLFSNSFASHSPITTRFHVFPPGNAIGTGRENISYFFPAAVTSVKAL